ncbi:MAG: hypothetical protein KDC73_06620 [Ignavibacteriae bacterium]|nr:hypothetical protein [Ignavibacteriota bacterium]MCB9243596.1 hypothetical protein [Ignavibacteriales bacterium]
MRPIFTIHAGEYLVASELEKNKSFKKSNANIWIPGKDTGIDLLLTDKTNRRTVSLQVKFSKSFEPVSDNPEIRKRVRSQGWWIINSKKLKLSLADFWVFVTYSFDTKQNDFIIVKPKEFYAFLRKLKNKPDKNGSYHLYSCVTRNDKALETRGLSKKELEGYYFNFYNSPTRNLTKFLNNWNILLKKLKT